jgi:hypothetical protein
MAHGQVMSMKWPLVAPNDDGIRPAGRPNECFYCRQRVGKPHARDCVCIKKRVELKVTATLPDGEVLTGFWQLDEPHHADAGNIEYHKNKSSWCASNFVRAREAYLGATVTWDCPDSEAKLQAFSDAQDTKDLCICNYIEFRYVRIIDATPRRRVRWREEDKVDNIIEDEAEFDKFIAWINAQIAGLEAGGPVPDCFDGTAAECIESMKQEREEMLAMRKEHLASK